ncbi:MAG TPA: response regulator [Clostridiaceae bacterium]|nr:response regulator [Clostridiaceae bacterium]
MNNIKILIAEDEEFIRKSLVNKVKMFFEQAIVYEAEDGRQAEEIILSFKPDIVLTDIRIPYLSGLELMKRCNVKCKFIVISAYSDFD